MKNWIIYFVVGMAILSACKKIMPAGPEPGDALAEPIPSLSPSQMASHAAGDEAFARVFSRDAGLGPIFVNSSCEGCHAGDGKGHPFSTLTRFGKYDGNTWDPMIAQGGPQLQHRSIAGYPAEKIPADVTGITQLLPPAVTGLGFVEAMHDSTLLALADPDDSDGDNISGVPNLLDPPDFFKPGPQYLPQNGKYIGRFGRKAGAIDLMHQSVAAYINDIGITSDFMLEDLYNPQVGVGTGDLVADPEVGSADVNNVVFYLRTLKVPPRGDVNAPGVKAGEQIFNQIGCAKCHIETLVTAKSDVEALSEKTFHPYSDFLLHDMGLELDDGYIEGISETYEWRTTPLWGFGLSVYTQGGSLYLMHDGRARNIDEAILLHGGEAAESTVNYRNLSQEEKNQLLEFVNSL